MIRPVAARRGPSRPATVVSLCFALALIWQPICWARAITRVDIRPDQQQTVIALFTPDKQPLEANSFSLANPARIVFDFPGAILDPDLPSTIPVAADAVQQIRLGQFSADPDIARLVVDLSDDSPFPLYQITPGAEPGETLIALNPPGPTMLAPPSTELLEGASLIRLAGAGRLQRKVAVLADPPRIYADITVAVIEQSHEQEFAKGAIREIRMAQQPADPEHPVARIVLELSEQQAHIAFTDGPDLVFAIGPEPWALPLPEYRPNALLKGKRIVVDPGHGGHDIGAPALFGRNPKGPFEKDIVLDIALRLARLLNDEGAAVTLTRKDDTYIGLRPRAARANDLKADAFVSIHCDSCESPNTLHGTSVYYDHAHSRHFASLMQQELVAALGTADRGVRNANFAVIRRTQGPGVLAEIAYINHNEDRARLVHPNFRERAARALLAGIVSFLSDDPNRSRETP